jgi:hypothetical protein
VKVFGKKNWDFKVELYTKTYKKTQLLYRTHNSLIAKNSSEMNINTVDQKYIEKLKSKNTLVIKFLNLFLLFSYCSANY